MKYLSFFSVIIWIFVTLFYCFQDVLRLLTTIIRPGLMQQFLFGYFFHIIIGIVLDFFWYGMDAENILTYGTMTSIKAVSIIQIMLFFAAIIFLIFSYQETKKIKECT